MPYFDPSLSTMTSLSRMTPVGQQPQTSASKGPMPDRPRPEPTDAMPEPAKRRERPARPPWAPRKYNLLTWSPNPTAITQAIVGDRYVKDYTENAFARK